MKKLILLAITAFCAVQMHGQGTVTFANSSTQVITNKLGASLPTLSGYTVGLYFGAAGTVDESLLTLNSTTIINPVAGRFAGGTKVLSGIAEGAQAVIQIRAWSGAFANFAAASAAALVDGVTEIGKSALFTVTTGSPNGVPTPTLPAAFTPLTRFLVTSPVPEPSSIALGLLGLGAVAFFRRRK